jgi:hypothetical protein
MYYVLICGDIKFGLHKTFEGRHFTTYMNWVGKVCFSFFYEVAKPFNIPSSLFFYKGENLLQDTLARMPR